MDATMTPEDLRSAVRPLIETARSMVGHLEVVDNDALWRKFAEQIVALDRAYELSGDHHTDPSPGAPEHAPYTADERRQMDLATMDLLHAAERQFEQTRHLAAVMRVELTSAEKNLGEKCAAFRALIDGQLS